MSGLGAGCPASHEESDVRAFGRMSGPELPDSSALWLGQKFRAPEVLGVAEKVPGTLGKLSV